jgi:ribosome-associated translation inhibitor RaiA
MRLVLTGTDVVIGAQLQAYVEYRIFTAIAGSQALIRGVNVTLKRNPRTLGQFLCIVTLDCAPASHMRIRASGPHPNAAIDRAAARVSLRLSQQAS